MGRDRIHDSAPARRLERPANQVGGVDDGRCSGLLGWHRRYGDVFTVEYLIFGTGVYVADPAAIRELLTGDQSDLRAGEANEPLAPSWGATTTPISTRSGPRACGCGR